MASALRPHVVIAALSGQGHIIPAFRLARSLASAGLHLTFVAAQDSLSKIESEVQAAAAEELGHIQFVGIPLMKTVEASHRNHVSLNATRTFLLAIEDSQMMNADFELLMDKLVCGSLPELKLFGPPLAIISDYFYSWGQVVGSKLRIPWYVLYASPARLLAVQFYYPSLVAQGRLPLQVCNSEDAKADAVADIISVPGLGPITLRELPMSLKDSSSKIVQQFFLSNACRLHQASGVFVNSFYELESGAIDALNGQSINPKRVPIFPIGPLLPRLFFADDSPVASASSLEPNKFTYDWMDSQSPSSVLYISFGSLYTPSKAQIYEIALGLEASQRPFFWVLPVVSTSDSIKGTGISSLLPEGFEQRTQNRGVLVSGWVAQPLILSHRSTGGFLTHCGWNSTLESICSGVPMIAFPQFAEQELICTLVVDQWKVGLRLARGIDGLIRGADLESAARRLFSGSEEVTCMRNRIVEMRNAARRAIMQDGYSSSNLQAFVREIVAKAGNKESSSIGYTNHNCSSTTEKVLHAHC